jgi:hypothetical protein
MCQELFICVVEIPSTVPGFNLYIFICVIIYIYIYINFSKIISLFIHSKYTYKYIFEYINTHIQAMCQELFICVVEKPSTVPGFAATVRGIIVCIYKYVFVYVCVYMYIHNVSTYMYIYIHIYSRIRSYC